MFNWGYFWVKRCDCGEQLDGAFRLINEKGSGVYLIWLKKEEGLGFVTK